LVAVKLFPQAKKTAGEPEAEAAVVYPTAVSASTLDFCTLKDCTPPVGNLLQEEERHRPGPE
jgi:hypothetical protein